MDVSGGYKLVDYGWCRGRVFKDGLTFTDGLKHIPEDVKIPIAQSVVEESFGTLKCGGRAADDMNDGHTFRISPSNTIDGREFSDTCKLDRIFNILIAVTKSGYESAQSFDSGVAIGGIGRIELVAYD
jgi:hypothetical protein